MMNMFMTWENNLITSSARYGFSYPNFSFSRQADWILFRHHRPVRLYGAPPPFPFVESRGQFDVIGTPQEISLKESWRPFMRYFNHHGTVITEKWDSRVRKAIRVDPQLME